MLERRVHALSVKLLARLADGLLLVLLGHQDGDVTLWRAEQRWIVEEPLVDLDNTGSHAAVERDCAAVAYAHRAHHVARQDEDGSGLFLSTHRSLHQVFGVVRPHGDASDGQRRLKHRVRRRNVEHANAV